MGDIINLRKVRKAKAREAGTAEAALNRARHGRTPAEREREAMEAEHAKRLLDGAKTDEA